MTAAAIIRDSAAAGVTLSLSAAGTIKAAGDQGAVDHWLPAIKENKAAIVGLLAKGTAAAVSWLWLIHFPDRNPLEVAFAPAATHGEVLNFYPDARAAEPIAPGRRPLGEPLTEGQEHELRAWLAPTIADYPDERRFCTQCLNLRGAVCSVAKPGGLVSAVVGYRPARPELPRRCAGFAPSIDDPDQRPGRERWPGFTQRGTRNADH
jgi:hypothetical protein